MKNLPAHGLSLFLAAAALGTIASSGLAKDRPRPASVFAVDSEHAPVTSALVAQEKGLAPAPAANAQPGAVRLTLEEAKDLALSSNRQLHLGRLNLEEKQIAVSAAKRDYFPKVLGSAAYIRFNDNLGTVLTPGGGGAQGGGKPIGPGGIIKIPSPTLPETIAVNVVNQDTAVGMIMVAQPITKLIGVSALVDLARADEGIASAQLDKGTSDLLSGVSQAYYGLLAASRIHQALSLQAGALEPILKQKPTPELRLASLELRKGLVEAEKNVTELTETLNQLLGFPLGTRLELVEPALPPIAAKSAEEAAELALFNNPQVREAEQNITKARAGLKVAKMDYIPDVSVIGAYTAQSAADYIQEDFGAVGIIGSYTFFDWGKRKQVKFQRQTQMALAMQNVQATVETVQLEARKAFLAFKQAEAELQIANEVVKARQDAEKEAKEAPAVLAAKAATAKAMLDLMQAELNYRLEHAKLLAVIGQP